MKNRILINIFSNNVGRTFEMVLGLALIPFLIKVLGMQGFGLIILAEAIIGFFDMAVNGFRLALGRYVGLHLTQNNQKETNAYIASGEVILLGIIAITSIVGLTIWIFFTKVFNVPFGLALEMRMLFLLMVFSFLLRMRFVPAWSILYSYQRFDLLNINIGLRNLTRFLLCFLVYWMFSPKLHYYGWIYLTAIAVEQILNLRGAKKLFPKLKIEIKNASLSKIKELFSFMSFRTIGSLGHMLYAQTDMVLINRFFGASFNTTYSISLKFVNVLKRLISRSLWGVTPSFTELVAKKDYARIERIYTSITKISALISIPVSILLGLFGRELIILWVGEKSEGAVIPMYIHILGLLPSLVFAGSGGVTMAFSKVKIPSLVTLFCAILNVILSLLFALRFKMGLVGFALGATVATFIQTLWFIPYYSCRVAGIPYLKFYLNSFIKPLTLGVVFGLFLYYLKFIIGVHSFLIIFLIIPLCMISYFTLSYYLILNHRERSQAKETFFEIWAKLKKTRFPAPIKSRGKA